MTENISDEVLDRLEAEAKVADAQAEELTIAVESDIEQKEERVEELEAEVEEKDAEVEQLRKMKEEKEDEIEELREEIDSVAEDYAEELAQDSDVLGKEDFLDKFEFEELREKANELETESEPAPNSGDPGAGIQEPEDGQESESGETEEVELTEEEELAAEQWRQRGRETGKDYWIELAEDIESGD